MVRALLAGICSSLIASFAIVIMCIGATGILALDGTPGGCLDPNMCCEVCNLCDWDEDLMGPYCLHMYPSYCSTNGDDCVGCSGECADDPVWHQYPSGHWDWFCPCEKA